MRKTTDTQAKNLFQENKSQSQTTHKQVRSDRRLTTDSTVTFADFGAVVFQLLQQLVISLPKILLYLRYQFFPKSNVTGGVTLGAPALKLGAVAALAFVAMKSDFRIQVSSNNSRDKKEIWKDDRSSERVRPAAEAMSVGFREKATPRGSNANPFAPVSAAMLSEAEAQDYIQKFSKVAVQEMRQFGIPASVCMAQALVESRSGNSVLSKKNNNHFGIKCFSHNCKKGHCTNFTDDNHKDFFRKFDSPWQSWREHSKLIASGRYASLQRFGRDYKSWARGLKEAGYASDADYHEKLIDIIEKFKLFELDK